MAASSTSSAQQDKACAQVYMSRMLKLKQKLDELHIAALLGLDFVPQQFIDVGWGDRDTENVALFGNELPLSRTWVKPSVIFEASDDVMYTVICVDVDHETQAPYLLWLRVNVCGDTKYASGRDLVRWQSPHPAEGRGPHRIFLVVFHQSGGAVSFETHEVIAKNSTEGRGRCDVAHWTQRLQLGHVIGANCWRTSFDASVVPRVVSDLRDRVILDETGRRVVAEELDGVRVYEYKAPRPPSEAEK